MITSPDFFRYASSFRFSGDYVDDKDVDALGRRKTKIVAIDALCGPGMRQYREKYLLRLVNLHLCGYSLGCRFTGIVCV
jgi:poly(ADP-ribose) glycohydrolase